MLTRRSVMHLMAAAGLARGSAAVSAGRTVNPLRIRTLTAGVSLARLDDPGKLEAALAFLAAAKRRFEAEGYEVQTTRVALAPLVAGLDASARERALSHLERLDRMARDNGSIVSIGPVKADDAPDSSLPEWSAELARTTQAVSFSIAIASESSVRSVGAASAAQVITALAQALPDGMANFRFAAAANIPAGTPFFPVAWHEGADSFAVGLEAAGVVEQALRRPQRDSRADEHLKNALDQAFRPVEQLAKAVATDAGRVYLGIDASPAPGLDRSIGAAVEAYTQAPFGAAGTLEACALITGALKSVSVRTCGYSGLMLPVLEDPVLARRATEKRYGVRDLLLFSSVCGTGLDVVPIAGDTSTDVIERLLRDVAALSVRLRKPLSARLFVVPGKKAGEMASFDNPWLTACSVMPLD
jgi:uncharacterized protein (UPF0210 family)